MIAAANTDEMDDLKAKIAQDNDLNSDIKEIFLTLIDNSLRLTKPVAIIVKEEEFPNIFERLLLFPIFLK